MSKTKKQGPAATLFEKGVPLESSVIWTWMRNYYSEGGVSVWSDGDVPFHITNTPMLAQEWTKSILAILRDFNRLGKLDLDAPVEVFELGPGTGRHAYFLLNDLRRMKSVTERLFGKALTFRLHLAELGKSGLQALADHSHLKDPIESGELFLHQFDIESDIRPNPFSPTASVLEEPSPNPVFVISNYILDSLSHDVLKVLDGELYRGLTRLSVKGLKKGKDPMKLKHLGEKMDLTFTYEDQPLSYPEPVWNEVADHYRALHGESYIPFPTSSLRLGMRARKWSRLCTCFLVADKSFTAIDQMMNLDEPELVPHGGGFSFNANLHAFGVMALKLGGQAHHTSPRDGTMELSHVVIPAEDVEADWNLVEAELRCRELEDFNAIDRFRTKESVDDRVRKYGLRLCLDLLRLGGFDPQIFYELSDHILKGLTEESDELAEMEEELMDALPRCISMIFPLPDDCDVAFEAGRVAYRMDAYELAHHAFSLSLIQYGEDPRTRFNLGLTWYYRNRFDLATEDFDRALELDPDYEDAQTWSVKAQRRQKEKAAGF